MQSEGGYGPESVFITPPCNPFKVSKSPKTHYFPSSIEFQSSDLQHTLLTPEKPYTPAIKDNNCYSPVNYSFYEEEKETFSEKPQVENYPASILSQTSSRMYVEQWPSTNGKKSAQASSTKSCKETTPIEPQNLESNKVESLGNDILDLDSGDFMKPKMASTHRSAASPTDLSALVNRFRYGKPLPPEERKRSNSATKARSRPPSNAGTNSSSGANGLIAWQLQEKSSSKKSVPDSMPIATLSVPTSSEETLSTHNDSFTELHERVERILKDSTLALNSHQSSWSPTLNSVPSSYVSSQPTSAPSTISPQTPEFPSSGMATDSPASYSSTNMSSTNSDARTLLPDYSRKDPKPELHHRFPSPAAPQPRSQPRPRPERLPDDFPPSLHTGQQFSAPSKIPFKNDILQQWRLKRKMESARASPSLHHRIGNTQALPAPALSRKDRDVQSDGQRFPPAERPFDCFIQPQTPYYPQIAPVLMKTRSVGVSTVSGMCAQTQTSPTSSLSPEDLSSATSTDPSSSKRVTKDAEISLHKVTVVQGTTECASVVPPSPPSDHSNHASTDTWSDLHSSKNIDTLSQISVSKSNEKELQSKISSPTTAVVKQVVGARLFDTTTETLKVDPMVPIIQEDDDSFQSKGDGDHLPLHTSLQGDSDPPTEHAQGVEAGDYVASSPVKTDPDQMLKKVLDAVELEDSDFLDDPVLSSLRQQREKYLIELRVVEEKLKSMEQKGQFGDGDRA